MSDLKPQLLLTGRPTCTRCMHSHMVETVTGREKTPLEYHCGYCGNYAIVGINTRWPFMVAVKSESKSVRKVVQRDHDDAGSSPLQLGESLVKASANYSTKYSKPSQRAVITKGKPAKNCKPKEEKSMGKPRCEREGCRETSEALFLCKSHFRDVYGITVEEYRANKLHRTETVANVVRRLKGESGGIKAESGEVKNNTTFEKLPPIETALVGEERTAIPKVETKQVDVGEPIPLFRIFLDPELLEKLTARAKAEYRTAEQQAAYILHKELSA